MPKIFLSAIAVCCVALVVGVLVRNKPFFAELNARFEERSLRADCNTARLQSPEPVQAMVTKLSGGHVNLTLRNVTNEEIYALVNGIGGNFRNDLAPTLYAINPAGSVSVGFTLVAKTPAIVSPDIVYSYSHQASPSSIVVTSLAWPIYEGKGFVSQSPEVRVKRPTHTVAMGNENAVDIVAPFGSVIVAAESGRVVSVVKDNPDFYCTDRSFDNRVVIRSDDGMEIIYGHLMRGSTKVKQGERVQVGAEIARVGRSGGMKRSHLHIQKGYLTESGYKTAPISFRR